MNATYSPEDDKIRLYVGRVSREDYEALRAAGFVATLKQDCDFVAFWTPKREDLAREFLDDGEDIGDEGYSPVSRAADRAERFESYQEKRTAEAVSAADRFEAGPAAFGNQSRARAERQAKRHDRTRTLAVSQWSKAEYWRERTAGVIANALHRADAKTRRGRILAIEAELRKCQRSPEGRERWIAHYEMRLEYERAMLANEGGTAADADMVAGGWIGDHQIHGVNRSPVTGRVVSVKLMLPERWFRGQGPAPLKLRSVNIERLPEGKYRAPTEEEAARFSQAKKEAKAKAKAEKAPATPIINPTDEDAEKLQAFWNAHHDRRRKSWEAPSASTVLRITQAEYSANSKGEYAALGMSTVTEFGLPREIRDKSRAEVYKVRTRGGGFSSAKRVIVLTDKPRTPIPWDAVSDAYAAQVKESDIFHRWEEIVGTFAKFHLSPDEEKLLSDAVYLGLAFSASMTQKGLTDAGKASYERFRAIIADGGTPTEHGTYYPAGAK